MSFAKGSYVVLPFKRQCLLYRRLHLLHRFIFMFFLCFSFHSAHARESFTISGYIKDAATGEELFGVSCYIPELKVGGMTNDYGFYSLTIPEGSYVIRYSYIGYEPLEFTIDITSAPPEYGGRLSSVLDIRMKEGNMKKFTMTGGIGSVSSRLTVQGPIVKDKGSFMIAGRRTYVDLFMKLSKNSETRKVKLYFYDLNMKANYHVGENDRLFISGYFGRDVFGYDDIMGVNWGNKTSTIRWNHLFNNRLFLNSSLIYSKFDYAFNIEDESENTNIELSSSIRDINLKKDFEYFINSKSLLKFGFNGIYHTFLPGKFSVTDADSSDTFSISRQNLCTDSRGRRENIRGGIHVNGSG